MLNYKFVSIIIPCLNEETYIAQCLDSVLANNYPVDQLEVLVLDGMSQDKTREIIKNYVDHYSFIRLIDNPKITQPTALNLGIKSARGEIIIRIDAHSYIAPDFIIKSLEYLNKTGATCVGGPIETVGQGFIGRAIALVLSSSFGVGGSRFRTSKKEGYVDTIPFGAYRKEVFEKNGYFNENLPRSEDNDFNYRLRQSGGKLFMTPAIKVFYQGPATLKKLFIQAFNNGWWSIRTLLIEKNTCLSLRHFVPLFFTSGVIFFGLMAIFIPLIGAILSFLLFIYLILAILGSLIVIKQRTEAPYYIFFLPWLFFLYHFFYGLGSLLSFFNLFKKST